MTFCTAAAIVSLLGYMPPPGSVISVPASALTQYSSARIGLAKACARRYKIRYEIINDAASHH